MAGHAPSPSALINGHAPSPTGVDAIEPSPAELSGPSSAEGALRSGKERHPFQPGSEVRIDAAERLRPLCGVSGCGMVANAQRHRGFAPPKAPVKHRRPKVGVMAEPTPVEPAWEVHLLAHAIDVALDLPTDKLGWLLRLRLAEARRTLGEDFPGLIAEARSLESAFEGGGGDPVESDSGTRVPQTRPLSIGFTPNPVRAARKLRRGIRNDRVRALFDRAIEAGWHARATGSGHIALLGPGAEHLSLSTTMTADGHGWGNLRSAARRMGIDVAGL